MKTINTNWSSPKTNLLAGMNCLRKALASGCRARLVRMRNEDCSYPIRNKQADTDFRNYKHMYGTTSSVNKINEEGSMSAFLTLNYVSVFGDKEAAEHYYETGKLKRGALHTPGFNFLVQVDDLIKYHKNNKDYDRARLYERQYRAPEGYGDVCHWFDFFTYRHGSPYAVKKFKKRLWVVELLKDDQPKPRVPFLVHLISVLVYPLKWIPKKDVLRMDEYRCVTYRIGDVVNGLAIEFHIPKKFSFN